MDRVTVDEPSMEGSAATTAAPPTPSAAALASYQRTLRPWRIAYAVAITVVVIIGLVVVKIAYNHGEISHTKLVTAASAAPSVALATPSASLAQAWASTDHAAIGAPYWGGTVITYGEHAVVGRDSSTGAVRWSYRRDDRTVCQAIQLAGVTIAVFELHGNCDELTALDSGTGVRKWTRTLDKDGHPLNGQPSYTAAMLAGGNTAMFVTKDVIYAVDPGGGLDRWVFAEKGCTINGAVLGSSGALISQTCSSAADCQTPREFCGLGPQLLLRDGYTGDKGDDPKNPDQIKWNLFNNSLLPVSADSVISGALVGGSTLNVFGVDKGKVVARLPLASPADAATTATGTASAELIRTGGITYALQPTATAFTWRVRTAAPVAVTSTDQASPPDLPNAIVTVSGPGGITVLDSSTGKARTRYPLANVPDGALAYPFGSGFVIAGATTAVYQ